MMLRDSHTRQVEGIWCHSMSLMTWDMLIRLRVDRLKFTRGPWWLLKAKKDGLYHLVGETMTGNIALAEAPEDQNLLGKDKVSHGANTYFLFIVDDYSRKVWVCLLKHKSDAFSKFKQWKTLIENLTDKKIKTLRTDNGLEFCNEEFDSC